jgi:zinc protease
LKSGAVELSVVGDVPWEEASAAVASTLGALPARQPAPDLRAAAAVRPARPPARPKLLGVEARVKQNAIAWYWPATARDIRETRRCHVLAAVLRERFRHQLREELGVSYATTAAFVELHGFPHLEHFSVYAEMDPRHQAQAAQIFAREAKALAEKGPTDDEFTRAKEPYLRDMADNLRTNIYWGRTVLSDAQQNPLRLAAARNRAADILTISRAEIAALARAHLNPARAFKFSTVPVATPPEPKTAANDRPSPAKSN